MTVYIEQFQNKYISKFFKNKLSTCTSLKNIKIVIVSSMEDKIRKINHIPQRMLDFRLLENAINT